MVHELDKTSCTVYSMQDMLSESQTVYQHLSQFMERRVGAFSGTNNDACCGESPTSCCELSSSYVSGFTNHLRRQGWRDVGCENGFIDNQVDAVPFAR